MRPFFTVLFLLLIAATARSQSEQGWEQAFHEAMNLEDEESDEWVDNHELLSELATHPMDINRATREQLEALPFLTALQVEEIME